MPGAQQRFLLRFPQPFPTVLPHRLQQAVARLPSALQGFIIEFLNTLILFPPDDTASNLDPGDPSNPAYPQRGHGSIALSQLFNDPTEGE